MNRVYIQYCAKSAKFNNKNHAKQHSEECKSLPSCSYDMLQAVLAVQAKPSLQGNKNKTGSFDGESINMEERDNDSASTSKKVIDDNKTFDVMVNDQSENVTHDIADMYKEPHLGNKTKMGLWVGTNVMSEMKIRKMVLTILTWQLKLVIR